MVNKSITLRQWFSEYDPWSAAPAALPGNVLEMQILGHYLNILIQKFWRWVPAIRFDKPSRQFWGQSTALWQQKCLSKSMLSLSRKKAVKAECNILPTGEPFYNTSHLRCLLAPA